MVMPGRTSSSTDWSTPKYWKTSKALKAASRGASSRTSAISSPSIPNWTTYRRDKHKGLFN